MTIQPVVEVLILGSGRCERCEARCGLDWSAPEVLRRVRELLGKVYGEKVQLEYFDLDNTEIRRLYAEVVKRIEEENLPSPVLVLNGKIRLSGYFDARMLQDAIQAEIELSCG